MSELRGRPESSDSPPDADWPRPESLAERHGVAPTSRGPLPENTVFERPGLTTIRDRLRETIADRFGRGTAADDAREVDEIHRPAYTRSYYTDLPRVAYDRYLVRDEHNPIPAFDGPPTRDQVKQGLVGDCGIIATIGAVAGHRPDAIRNAIRRVGDGTYEVTFHKVTPATWTNPVARPTGETTTYRLSDQLPVNLEEPDAPPAAARPETCAWPALVEKVVAGQDQTWDATRQAAWDQEWSTSARHGVDDERLALGLTAAPADAPTGYDRLNVGSTSFLRADLLAELTGEEAEVRLVPDEQEGEQALLDEFRDQLDHDKPVIVGARQDPGNAPVPFAGFRYGHVYEVTNVADDKIHLRDPWGEQSSPAPIDVTTFWNYFRNTYPDGSRSGSYTTLR